MRRARGESRLVVVDGEADTALVAQWEASRRDVIRRGLVAGGVSVVAATAVPLLLRVRNAFAQDEEEDEAAVLKSAAKLELVASYAYGTAARSGALDGDFARLVRRLRDQERDHARALNSGIEALGGRAPEPPPGLQDVDRVADGLRDADTQARIAMFAIELETAAVAAYHDAHAKLRTAHLLQTAASIMASEGQHLVVLRRALGRDPLPHAFEAGRA